MLPNGDSKEEKIKRVHLSTLDCEKKRRGVGDGCPKGHWSTANDFGLREQAAYNHYVKCKATGRWPDDPLFDWIVGIIATAEKTALDALDRSRHDTVVLYLKAIARVPHGR